jgi:hypothetical protein
LEITGQHDSRRNQNRLKAEDEVKDEIKIEVEVEVE